VSAVHERLELPDGAVISCEVEIVGYIDPEKGDLAWALRTNAEAPTSTVVGLMEMAKANYISLQQRADGE
jgi:hypothetical protein